jgi:hypothetical protein
MADFQDAQKLIAFASDPTRLQAIQSTAAAKLLAFDQEIYPTDGCAITLSLMLQAVGIDVADTYMAFDLAKTVKDDRGWTRVDVGSQAPGDIGTTCGQAPMHGTDHIYFVLNFRWASGQGKSPTQYFLRAAGQKGS